MLPLCQAVLMAAWGAYPDVPVVVTGLAVAGVAAGIWDVIVISFRQHVVPDRLPGRVTSGFRLVGIGAIPIGALLSGALAGVAAVSYLRGPDLKVNPPSRWARRTC